MSFPCASPRCQEAARWRVGRRDREGRFWLGVTSCDAHVGDARRDGDVVELLPSPSIPWQSWHARVRRAVGSALFWSIVSVLSPALLALWLLYLGEHRWR